MLCKVKLHSEHFFSIYILTSASMRLSPVTKMSGNPLEDSVTPATPGRETASKLRNQIPVQIQVDFPKATKLDSYKHSPLGSYRLSRFYTPI